MGPRPLRGRGAEHPIFEENGPEKFKGVDIMRAVRSFDPCLPCGVHMYDQRGGQVRKVTHTPPACRKPATDAEECPPRDPKRSARGPHPEVEELTARVERSSGSSGPPSRGGPDVRGDRHVRTGPDQDLEILNEDESAGEVKQQLVDDGWSRACF
jgi:hypothetical protein